MANAYRRAAVKQMRWFLKREGVKKGQVERFRRRREPDGSVSLIAEMKDGRTAAIGWKP